MVLQSSPWIEYARPNPAARARLFCLPYAGGTAAIYRDWHGGALSDIDVCPIQLPARERRLGEPPFERILLLVRELAAELPTQTTSDLPFAFFGHSMGGLIAFELARELRRQGRAQPSHLFVSGSPAPQLSPNRPPRFRLDRASLIKELRSLGGTPEVVLESPELLDLVLPAIRADFALIDTYQYSDEPPLNCTITAMSGDRDAEVEEFDVIAWREQSLGRFKHIRFPGNHFFIHSDLNELKIVIAESLFSAQTSAL